jgi:hypothetical protein
MNYYFAPLEGITGYLYRNTYEKHFGGVSKYFSPFIEKGKILDRMEQKCYNGYEIG